MLWAYLGANNFRFARCPLRIMSLAPSRQASSGAAMATRLRRWRLGSRRAQCPLCSYSFSPHFQVRARETVSGLNVSARICLCYSDATRLPLNSRQGNGKPRTIGAETQQKQKVPFRDSQRAIIPIKCLETCSRTKAVSRHPSAKNKKYNVVAPNRSDLKPLTRR